MYWFGWITTSAVLAAIVATIVAYLPDNLTRKLPAAAAWAGAARGDGDGGRLMIHMYFLR